MCGEGNKTEVGEQLRTAADPCYLGLERRRRKNLKGQMNSSRTKSNSLHIVTNSWDAEDFQAPDGKQKEQ